MVHLTFSKDEVVDASVRWLGEQMGPEYGDDLIESIRVACSDMCKNHWFKENPQRASGLRALTFETGELPFAIKKAAVKANVCLKKLRKDIGIPCEFSIFMDPDGCSITLKWGLRSREEDQCEIFPRNKWDAYYEMDLPQRLLEFGTVKVTQVKDQPQSKQNCFYSSARNTPSPPFVSRVSPIMRYSPPPQMGRAIVRTTPKSSYRSSSPETPTSDVKMFDSSILDTVRCGDAFMPSFISSFSGELGTVSS